MALQLAVWGYRDYPDCDSHAFEQTYAREKKSDLRLAFVFHRHLVKGQQLFFFSKIKSSIFVLSLHFAKSAWS